MLPKKPEHVGDAGGAPAVADLIGVVVLEEPIAFLGSGEFEQGHELGDVQGVQLSA